jgi:hypothetical protein
LVAVFLAGGLGAPVLATSYIAQMTGTTSFTDIFGTFGSVGVSYTSIPFLASIRFTDENPASDRFVTPTSTFVRGSGTANPILAASLTINNIALCWAI